MLKDNYRLIIKEIDKSLSGIKEEEFKVFIDSILKAENIFVIGAGRMGIMMSAFCMRLYQLGFKSYVVGSIISPAITDKDLLIVGSSSGETKTILQIVKIAYEFRPDIFAITANSESSIVNLSSNHIYMPGPYSVEDSDLNIRYSKQPMKALFEQSLLILLDSAILQLLSITKQSADDMAKRHANLE